MSFLYELWVFMRARKKYWLLPVIIVTLRAGGLQVFMQAPKKYRLLPVIIVTLLPGGLIAPGQGSAGAPMIYTIF